MKDKNNFTILFVEDSFDTRKNYVKYLERYFHKVYESADAESGYLVYQDKKPDILIIDINLPGMNGLELLRKIRKKDHKVKAIMLTAYSNKEYLLEATALKLTQYLIKPVTRDTLKKALFLAIDEISKFTINSNEILTLPENTIWNFASKKLFKESVELPLTAKETQLLSMLFENKNIELTYDDIIIEIWDEFENDKINSLKTLIKNLRKKLPTETIQNIYGIGFKVNI